MKVEQHLRVTARGDAYYALNEFPKLVNFKVRFSSTTTASWLRLRGSAVLIGRALK